MKTNKTLILFALIGIFNAISEASNQGHLNDWPFWFTQDAWMNKNTWHPIGLWHYWPFIIFTDAFHFFKTCWVICMAFIPIFQWKEFCKRLWIGKDLNAKLYWFALYFAIYSIFFQITYWII